MGEHGGGLVKEFMHRYLEVVSPKATVTAVAERMSVKRIGCLLVESDDPTRGPIGILTETDLVRKVLAAGLDPMVTTANQVMVSPIVTITGDRTMLDASHVMETNHIRHLCVAEAGEIVGIVSVRDLVRSFVDAESGPVSDLDQVYRPRTLMRARLCISVSIQHHVQLHRTFGPLRQCLQFVAKGPKRCITRHLDHVQWACAPVAEAFSDNVACKRNHGRNAHTRADQHCGAATLFVDGELTAWAHCLDQAAFVNMVVQVA